MEGMRIGTTPRNTIHAFWLPLRESLGSFPTTWIKAFARGRNLGNRKGSKQTNDSHSSSCVCFCCWVNKLRKQQSQGVREAKRLKCLTNRMTINVQEAKPLLQSLCVAFELLVHCLLLFGVDTQLV